jgi:organic hydroperoxide reductase OsmC/OhrA
MLEAGTDETRARELVVKAHTGCFIANSVAAPIEIAPSFVFAEAPAAVC